mgnify:CR=1 FL=1
MAKLRRWLADRSVRTKVRLVVVGVSVAAMAVMAVAYGVIGVERERVALKREVRALARITGANLAAAAVFADAPAASETLRTLRREPTVEAARVLLPDGRVLAQAPASWRGTWRMPADVPEFRLGSARPALVHPIRRDGRRVATLQVRVSTQRLREARDTLVLMGVTAVLGAVLAAWLLAVPLCAALLRPIEELVRAVERVREARDFAVRVTPRSRDEVGELASGFNEMLDEIRASSDRMQELVEQRTRDLAAANEALRATVDALEHAKQRAEASDAAKTRFLANMSHELRTPLNAIVGFSEMLKAGIVGQPANAKHQEYIDDIHASALHLLNIINDVLDVARLESGRFSLVESTTTVGALCRETERMLGVTAENRGIALHGEVDRMAELTLACDPGRMRQVLLNLVSNALKFTPRGGSVTITADRAGDGGVNLRVRDSGEGMDPEDVPTVLEPFGQVHSPYAREHQGTGLGLALCKQIVEMHAGTLTVDTAPGHGTTVTATLGPERVHDA